MVEAEGRGRHSDSAIPANTEYVPGDQNASGERQTENVPAIKTDQGGGSGLRTTHQERIQRSTKQRDGFDQIRTSDQRPVDALVPAQDVAGEIQQDSQYEQSHTKQIIEAGAEGHKHLSE